MKGEKTNEKAKQNGITLIALVITIIVLLILAAVSIATLTGENGILTRANNTKIETEEVKEDELRRLTALEAATNIENTTHKDNSTEEEKTVTIPAETAVSQVEGENTLADGLVIIDKNGNEWVWIEVPKSVTNSSTTDEEIENALINYAQDYRGDYTDTWYDGCGLEEQEYYENYSKMLQSIKNNGGFYLRRYEVGSFDDPVTAEDTTRKAVIQRGVYPNKYVKCSQAEELAEGLKIGENTSTLMYGTYLKPASNVLLTTGATERNSKMNIYDLAGNVWDMTLEKSIDTDSPCGIRGRWLQQYKFW